MSSIFLSHSHADKDFARRLARDLKRAGVRIWLDEAELKIGDSLIEKIRQGIDQMEYLGVLLSSNSVNSPWVRREVDVAMNQEIEGKRVKVLPFRIDDSDLPGFLEGKLYADFRDGRKYNDELRKVLDRLGIETTPPPIDSSALFTMLSGAIAAMDEDLLRKAIVGFMSLPQGSVRGLARDVLGSIKGWTERHAKGFKRCYEIAAQAILDGLTDADEVGLAAVEYLRNMSDYWPSPPSVMAQATSSSSLGERIGGNLCLYSYGLYGNTRDAEIVLPRKSDSVALRVAAAYTLGLSGHMRAVDVLTEIANELDAEPPRLQEAVIDGLDLITKESAPSQVVDALQAIIRSNVADHLRVSAARRFIEIIPRLHDRAQQQYVNGLRDARRIVEGNRTA
jgi:TIR domain